MFTLTKGVKNFQRGAESLLLIAVQNLLSISRGVWDNFQSPTYQWFRHTGCPAKQNAFVFWISRLPRGLKISSWTFLNSPFHVDFQNIHDFIIWLNLEQDIVKILQETFLKSWHFWFSTGSNTWALWITHQHSWALLRAQEHSWVPIVTH